jgi:hypothetical protein
MTFLSSASRASLNSLMRWPRCFRLYGQTRGLLARRQYVKLSGDGGLIAGAKECTMVL